MGKKTAKLMRNVSMTNPVPNRISPSGTSAAVGIARTNSVIGDTSRLKRGRRPISVPTTTPATTPIANPERKWPTLGKRSVKNREKNQISRNAARVLRNGGK
jgi:hypothetical protein